MDVSQLSTVALDPATGDLAIPFALLRAEDAVAQRLRCRLRFFQAEWFLDARQGVPYFRDVFVKNPNLGLIRSLIRRIILTTPGIASIREYVQNLTRETRILEIYPLVCVLDNGVELIAKPRDFIVALGV